LFRSILREVFETSFLWHKLERLIIVGCSYDSIAPLSVTVRFIRPVDVSDPKLIRLVKEYWSQIQQIVTLGEIANYSSKGTSSGFIQLRTKGSGSSMSICPITKEKFPTRAFYATKPFLRYILGVMG
jgi:DNA mismatch repair protein MutH